MSLYRPTGSKVYWMDFFFAGQRVRESTRMTSKTVAKRVEDKRKQDLREGAQGVRKQEAPRLFSIAFLDWIEAKKAKWSPKMLGIAENSMKHLASTFGKKLVVDIEAKDIMRYQKARLAEGASNRTVNIEVGCVRSVLKRHGLWARIQPKVEMLKERDDVGRALTADQERALLAECGKSRSRILLPFVVLAIETAARYGTIRRLQWKNLDFENRCLTFGKDKTRAGSGRTIPLTARARETMKVWAESFPDRQPDHFVFPREFYGGSGADETFGFANTAVYETDPTRPTGSVTTAWESARARTRTHCPTCKEGRLMAAEKGAAYVCSECEWKIQELPLALSKLRFHDLRHTGASRLIAARVPLPMVGKLLGWSAGTLAKMSARYGHFSMEELRSAVESISRTPDEISSGYPKKSPKSDAVTVGRLQ